MILQPVLPLIGYLVKICSFLNFTPIYWDKENNWLEIRRGWIPRQRKYVYFTSRLGCYAFGAFILINYTFYWRKPSILTLTEEIISGTFTFTYVMLSLFNLFLDFRSREMIQLMKCFVQVEKTFKGGEEKINTNEKFIVNIIRIILSWLLVILPITTIANWVLFAIMPCHPPFLGSIHLDRISGRCLLSENLTARKVSFIAITATFQASMWYILVTSAGFTIVSTFLICVICLYLFQCRLLNMKRRENTGASSIPTRGYVLIKRYLILTMLEIRFNDIFASIFLPLILSMITLVNIIFTVLLILLKSVVLSNPGLIVIPINIVNGYTCYIGITTTAGKVNHISGKCINQLARLSTNAGHFTKRRRALRQIRIRFAQNFIDIKTPLVMMSFCIVQIANVLILVRNKRPL
ncbi:hypothetical protein Fcan01_01075 [Folsomia candida]|uniref:Gustatory receptor n=1 Tax=Folsomia candida TaxID=158441 RepID=A0A226EVW4_FOLCA|nr:hypothetical protein Fcan01_01075 [Folsomia candida]